MVLCRLKQMVIETRTFASFVDQFKWVFGRWSFVDKINNVGYNTFHSLTETEKLSKGTRTHGNVFQPQITRKVFVNHANSTSKNSILRNIFNQPININTWVSAWEDTLRAIKHCRQQWNSGGSKVINIDSVINNKMAASAARL